MDNIITRYRYFPKEEWARRYKLIRDSIKENDLDAVLITSPENIFYLTGFHTTGIYYFQALVIPLKGDPFMLVRKMEKLGAICQTWIDVIHSYYDTEDPIEQLSHRINEINIVNQRNNTRIIRKMGYERRIILPGGIGWDSLINMMPYIEFVDIYGTVEEFRQTKSIYEINVMKLASIATVAAMKSAIDTIKVGCSDNNIASAIYAAAFSSGGEYPACPSFVAVGEKGAIGHQTWDGTIVKEGDIVFLEISGAKYRYHAPMMRTCYVGKELPVLLIEAEQLLCECLETCTREMRPGVIIKDIDAISKKILNRNSFGYIYDNRLGYSVGCAFPPGWGEDTVIDIRGTEERELKENMMFHLLPFMMIPNIGTVGISETVQITKAGAVSLFRDFPRKIFLIAP